MWYRRFPPVCAKCATLCQRPGGLCAGRSGLDLMGGVPPHDELEKLAEAGHIEWGIWLYRCRRCSSYWELDEWAYFPQTAKLRRVAPVASLEKWTAKQRRRMKPRSLLVASALVLTAGVLLLAAFAGIWWLMEMLFSRAVAEWVGISIVMAFLLLLYKEAQLQEALQVPKGAEP